MLKTAAQETRRRLLSAPRGDADASATHTVPLTHRARVCPYHLIGKCLSFDRKMARLFPGDGPGRSRREPGATRTAHRRANGGKGRAEAAKNQCKRRHSPGAPTAPGTAPEQGPCPALGRPAARTGRAGPPAPPFRPGPSCTREGNRP